MEGQVYVCGWKKERGKFLIWVEKRPEIKAAERTLAQAERAMLDQLCLKFGDGEAVLEFSPPLPPSKAVERFLDPHIVTLSGNTGAKLVIVKKSLFTEGFCDHCDLPKGHRSSQPLVIDRVESGYEGGSAELLPFFSEKFVGLLTDAERSKFEWRPVETRGRSHKTFYEPIAREEVPLVPVKGLSFETWVCDKCGERCDWRLWNYGCHIHAFVALETLPQPVPDCFTIGTPNRPMFCMRFGRWKQLVGSPGTKGIVTNDVGVVKSHEVDTTAAIFLRSIFDKLGAESSRLWDRYRAELMRSPEFLTRQSTMTDLDELYAYVNSQLDSKLTCREVNKAFGFPEWSKS